MRKLPASLSTCLRTLAFVLALPLAALAAAPAADFGGVESRLQKLRDAGLPPGNFSLAKAQCWLDTARTQWHENDRTGYVEEALAESTRIAAALESDRNSAAGSETPLVAGSARLREDLWARLGAMQSRQPALACTAQTVACAQVRLVRAGHAERQTGWRQASPHLRMVEDALVRADAQAAACVAAVPIAAVPIGATLPAAAPALARPAPAPVPASSAAPLPAQEKFIVLADTLFRFNKSERADMLAEGLAQLIEITQRAKRHASVQSIAITGHTDRLGSRAYNDRLSLARAETVKAFFAAQGVVAVKVVATGQGEREPVTTACTARSRKKLIACLQPDRRVTVEVVGLGG